MHFLQNMHPCLGAAVVSLGDGVKLLLARGVPQHQPHVLAVHPELLLQEVHPDGLLVALGEGASAVSLDHAGLAHGAVTNNHDLKCAIFT